MRVDLFMSRIYKLQFHLKLINLELKIVKEKNNMFGQRNDSTSILKIQFFVIFQADSIRLDFIFIGRLRGGGG